MIIIPGYIIAMLTFPGVICHEIAHLLFCRWFNVAVFKVCFFQAANPAGYVIHEHPRTFGQSFFISVGPFFVNTVVGALIAAPAMIPAVQFRAGTPMDYLLVWLGISIAMHAFPSRGDAAALWKAAKRQADGFEKTLAMPVIGLIYIGAFGSMFWLNLIFAVGVCMAVPRLAVQLLA